MQAGKAVAMTAPPGFLAFHRGAEASPEECGLLLMWSMTGRSMRLACCAVSGLQLHEVCARSAEKGCERTQALHTPGTLSIMARRASLILYVGVLASHPLRP